MKLSRNTLRESDSNKINSFEINMRKPEKENLLYPKEIVMKVINFKSYIQLKKELLKELNDKGLGL